MIIYCIFLASIYFLPLLSKFTKWLVLDHQRFGLLETSYDVWGHFFFFYCNYLWGTDINWVEDRDTAKHPIRHKTVPQKQTNKNHPDQKMWVVSGLRNFKSYSIPGALCISMTSRNWLFLFPLRLMTVVWLVLVLLCSKINPTKSPLTIPTV